MPDDHSYLPLGRARSVSTELDPTLDHYALQLYHRAWDDYRAAGCPYGPSDEAMFVWYSLSPGPNVISPMTSRN